MPVIPNTNQRYLTNDGASVYSLKQNTNRFLTDLAKLEQKNRIDNGYLSATDYDTSLPLYWTCSGVTSFDFVLEDFTSILSINASGSLLQNISRLKPNEEYTAIVFSSCPVSGSIEFGVYGPADQVFNINDSLEINKATVLVSNSAVVSKNIIQFNTNSTAVSGDIYVKLTNLSASAQTIEVQKILVYKGLIELDDVLSTDISLEDLLATIETNTALLSTETRRLSHFFGRRY